MFEPGREDNHAVSQVPNAALLQSFRYVRSIDCYLVVDPPAVRPNYPADVTDLVKVTADILNHGLTPSRPRFP